MFSNDVIDFRPQFKMHIMCNDAPQVDGSDSGVKRRIRKVDYMAQFVPKDEVDESNHCYLRDDSFVTRMRDDPNVRTEFLRLLLDNYDHNFQYDMPDIVKHNSLMYLEENDNVFKFVSEHIVKDKHCFFTLKQAKEAFKNSEYYNGKIQTLKNDLQKLLKVVCEESKRMNGKVERYVFCGYSLLTSSHENETSSASELAFKMAVENYLGVPFKKARPSWLMNQSSGKPLELDMYNASLNLAIEYDGPQHYIYPNQYHKSPAEFHALQERDRLKERLCSAHNVRLVRVRASTLDEELVMLQHSLKDVKDDVKMT